MKEYVPSEDYEQMMLVQWVRRTHPDLWIYAIPNGGYRSKAAAARMKATGVSAGVPDLCIPSLRVYIEMKRTKGGSTSKDQKKWIEHLRQYGYTVAVCKGCEEAKEFIINCLESKI